MHFSATNLLSGTRSNFFPMLFISLCFHFLNWAWLSLQSRALDAEDVTCHHQHQTIIALEVEFFFFFFFFLFTCVCRWAVNANLLVKVASRGSQETRGGPAPPSALQLTQQDTTSPAQQSPNVSSDVPRRRANTRPMPTTAGSSTPERPGSGQRAPPMGQVGRHHSEQVMSSAGTTADGAAHPLRTGQIAHQSSAPDVRRSPARPSQG